MPNRNVRPMLDLAYHLRYPNLPFWSHIVARKYNASAVAMWFLSSALAVAPSKDPEHLLTRAKSIMDGTGPVE